MREMPAEVVERWRGCWGDGVYFPRPWWRRVEGSLVLVMRRCDGCEVEVGVTAGAVGAALAAFDTESPLPRPPMMAGQVWWLPRPPEMPGQVWVHGGGIEQVVTDSRYVVPDGAVLVCGPTPWGMNVPWSGA